LISALSLAPDSMLAADLTWSDTSLPSDCEGDAEQIAFADSLHRIQETHEGWIVGALHPHIARSHMQYATVAVRDVRMTASASTGPRHRCLQAYFHGNGRVPVGRKSPRPCRFRTDLHREEGNPDVHGRPAPAMAQPEGTDHRCFRSGVVSGSELEFQVYGLCGRLLSDLLRLTPGLGRSL
jgi:hypothetical protein